MVGPDDRAAGPPRVEPRVSGEAVQRATGQGRDQWFALLDASGGTDRKHGRSPPG